MVSFCFIKSCFHALNFWIKCIMNIKNEVVLNIYLILNRFFPLILYEQSIEKINLSASNAKKLRS